MIFAGCDVKLSDDLPPYKWCMLDAEGHHSVKFATLSLIIILIAPDGQRLYACKHENFRLDRLTLKRERKYIQLSYHLVK